MNAHRSSTKVLAARLLPRWMSRLLAGICIAVILSASIGLVFAQQFGRGWGRRGSRPDRSSFPSWENDANFRDDVFTFVRIRYTPHYFRGWDADYPDADWNISLRLQQLTSFTAGCS